MACHCININREYFVSNMLRLPCEERNFYLVKRYLLKYIGITEYRSSLVMQMISLPAVLSE